MVNYAQRLMQLALSVVTVKMVDVAMGQNNASANQVCLGCNVTSRKATAAL